MTTELVYESNCPVCSQPTSLYVHVTFSPAGNGNYGFSVDSVTPAEGGDLYSILPDPDKVEIDKLCESYMREHQAEWREDEEDPAMIAADKHDRGE